MSHNQNGSFILDNIPKGSGNPEDRVLHWAVVNFVRGLVSDGPLMDLFIHMKDNIRCWR